jgi:hypothetical protein
MSNQKNALLNRAVFTSRTYDSRTLTVLTTLLHRFDEAGNYDLLVRRGDRVVHRDTVHVSDRGQQQINLDLKTLKTTNDRNCECHSGAQGHELLVNGMMGFFVSEGLGGFTVQITRLGEDQELVLDSVEAIPVGDLFAVTLVLEGDYTIASDDKPQARVAVQLPERGTYQPGGVTMVNLGEHGCDPDEVRLSAGHSVVFQIEAPTTIQVIPAEEQEKGAVT